MQNYPVSVGRVNYHLGGGIVDYKRRLPQLPRGIREGGELVSRAPKGLWIFRGRGMNESKTEKDVTKAIIW